MILILLIVAATSLAGQRSAPECWPESKRRAERIQGSVKRNESFDRTTPSGWIFRLRPSPEGWIVEVSTTERADENLARLTPPWQGPNPRYIEGWHFRNTDNTAPNDGSVNASQEHRAFIFSPEVGRSIEYNASGMTIESVQKVGAFGRGWLFIERYTLTPPQAGGRAAFEAMTFSVCLTWPDDGAR